MVKIIIESEDLVFTFRIHYQVDDAKEFAASKASLKNKTISTFLCHDFIREYCNLTAGAVKIWLQSNYSAMNESGDLTVNLPNQKPALAEQVPTRLDEVQEIYDRWHFILGSSRVLCSWQVDIHDWTGVTNLLLNAVSLDDQDDAGELEFL